MLRGEAQLSQLDMWQNKFKIQKNFNNPKEKNVCFVAAALSKKKKVKERNKCNHITKMKPNELQNQTQPYFIPCITTIWINDHKNSVINSNK